MTLMLSLLSSAVLADVQTLTLNTGFNHDTNQMYSLAAPKKDDFWTVLYDQTSVPIRLSDIMQNHSAWKPALPDSQWIAFAPNGIPSNNGQPRRVYVFQKCFCLKQGFNNDKYIKDAVLELNFRVDDWGAVYLNESLAAITGTNPTSYPFLPSNALLAPTNIAGGFNSQNPANLKISGADLVKRLRAGKNCLQVRVDDLGYVVSGFNLTGSLTAAGIDGVARGTDPKMPFNRCSSCAGMKNINEEIRNTEIIRINR